MALHLKAVITFTDVYGIERKAGSEWLIEKSDTIHTHILDADEELVEEVWITVLTSTQYCIVLNPIDENNVPRYGAQELRKGECKFFLNPGERIDGSIKQMIVL